jgi:stage II sporulation protein M
MHYKGCLDNMKKIDFNEQLEEAIHHVRDIKNYIYFSVILFVLSGVIGFIFFERLRFIDDIIADIISVTAGMSWFELIFFILQNNLQSAFFAFIFGIFFGVVPLVVTISNGLIVGYVFRLTFDLFGPGEFWRILPHGIFELPAIFISFGLGLHFGTAVLSGDVWREMQKRFYKAANVFLFIIVPLLIAAAVIEGLLIAFVP